MKVSLWHVTSNPEKIIEQAARVCYSSLDKITETSAANMLPKLLASGHETPFEHASATFFIEGVSRAMTHQLVRHRLMSVSQKSQRYVSEKQFEYVIPPSVKGAGKESEFKDDMAHLAKMYDKWREVVPKEDARFVLPNACTSDIVITANFREYMHIFKLRCDKHAQWEIRAVCDEMRQQLRRVAPLCFGV